MNIRPPPFIEFINSFEISMKTLDISSRLSYTMASKEKRDNMRALVLIILFASLLEASENKLLIHLTTDHFEYESPNGYKTNDSTFNETNEGIGYEYSSYSKSDSKLFYNISTSILNDSFYNAQYSLVYGINTLISLGDIGLQLGLNGGLCVKKVNLKNYLPSSDMNYHLLPIAFPRATIKFKHFDLNMVVIPTIETFKLVGFVHYSISVNFNSAS